MDISLETAKQVGYVLGVSNFACLIFMVLMVILHSDHYLAACFFFFLPSRVTDFIVVNIQYNLALQVTLLTSQPAFKGHFSQNQK